MIESEDAVPYKNVITKNDNSIFLSVFFRFFIIIFSPVNIYLLEIYIENLKKTMTKLEISNFVMVFLNKIGKLENVAGLQKIRMGENVCEKKI